MKTNKQYLPETHPDIFDQVIEEDKPLASKLTHGSSKNVRFICDKGHIYSCKVYNKCRSSKCSVCSGTRIYNGYNSAYSLFSEYFKDATEESISIAKSKGKSSKRVLSFQCPKGHEYTRSIFYQIKAKGNCPVCIEDNPKKKESIFITHPHIFSKVLDEDKEIAKELTYGSSVMVRFLCDKGCVYLREIRDAVRRNGKCSVCLNNAKNDTLPYTHKEIFEKVHDKDKNKARYLTAFSAKVITFVCENNHEYSRRVLSETKGKGVCPVCANQKVITGVNDISTTHPDIFEMVHTEDKDRAKTLSIGSKDKLRFVCDNGHISRRQVNNTVDHGCPKCRSYYTSKVEQNLFSYVNSKFPKSFNGHNMDVSWKSSTGHTNHCASVDIYIPELNLVIEFDGSYWHNGKESGDKNKTLALLEIGYNVVRIREHGLDSLNIKYSGDNYYKEIITDKTVNHSDTEYINYIAKQIV